MHRKLMRGAGGIAVGLLVMATGYPAAAAPASLAPAAPASPAPAAPARSAPFSAEMSAEFMRKVMETSARLEAVKQEIEARQAEIFKTHPEVKAWRAQLQAMQLEINKLLDTDGDLNALKLQRDIVWSTMPVLPRMPRSNAPPMGFKPLQ